MATECLCILVSSDLCRNLLIRLNKEKRDDLTSKVYCRESGTTSDMWNQPHSRVEKLPFAWLCVLLMARLTLSAKRALARRPLTSAVGGYCLQLLLNQ